MIKIKTAKVDGSPCFIIKSQKGQQLSERELYVINTNAIPGLLHIDVQMKGTAFKLIYNISGFITFKEYLNTPLYKEFFAEILKNILQNLKGMQEAFFNQECILLDFEHVLVNPATGKIYFLYVPIQAAECDTPLRDFLLNIIQFSTFTPNEDKEYIKSYIKILNSGINFSVFELEEYIKTLLGKPSANTESIECPQCHSRLKPGTNYCTACGAKISGNTANTGRGVYDPLHSDHKEPEIKKEDDGKQKYDTQGLSDGTTVLGEDPGGTTVLGSETLYEPNFPYLIREKTQEKITVDKPSFRIGKERQYSDYFVSDNSAVSRSHADIITREKRYFIIDLNSTNKTYVDGRAIPIQKEVEIFSGTKLRLANEDFVFYIE